MIVYFMGGVSLNEIRAANRFNSDVVPGVEIIIGGQKIFNFEGFKNYLISEDNNQD